MAVFRSDPCGIVCIFITYASIFYSDYVVVNWIILQTMHGSLWGAFHAVVFNTIIFLLILSHARAMLSDPGIVPYPESRIDFSDLHSDGCSDDGWSVCGRCEMYRPPRAHHCRVCRRCVRRMDHHCPWINNCVGEWNQKYFLQFLLYVAVLSVYALCLIAVAWIHCGQTCALMPVMLKQQMLMHSVLLSMEGILFGLFTAAILSDQLSAIFSDKTAVEQVQQKGPYRGRRPAMALLGEVCGAPPLMWAFPCALSSRPQYHKPEPQLIV